MVIFHSYVSHYQVGYSTEFCWSGELPQSEAETTEEVQIISDLLVMAGSSSISMGISFYVFVVYLFIFNF